MYKNKEEGKELLKQELIMLKEIYQKANSDLMHQTSSYLYKLCPMFENRINTLAKHPVVQED